MQVVEESATGLERKIKIEVPASRIDDAVQERLVSLAKTARINGFRPGKVPLNVVRKRYGGQVRQEVLGEVINQSYQEALTQENYRPAGMPSIEPVSQADDTSANQSDNQAEGSEESQEPPGFAYRATFEVYPEIAVADLDGAEIERATADVAASDVDEMIETLQQQRIEWKDEERAAQDGDQLTIDFVGKIDGEEFPGGSANEAPLVLGSNGMIPGFEEQLVGMSAGESRTISVDFPEDYRATELAGKTAQFDITAHGVKSSQLPLVDEEFAKGFGVEEGGVEALRADIQKNMERELGQSLENTNKQAVMNLLLEKNEFDVPQSLIKDEIGRLRQQVIDQMKERGQATEEPPVLEDKLFEVDATRRVKLGLLIAEVIRKNEIKPDPDKVRSTIETIASSYEQPQQVVEYYYSNDEYLQNIEGLVLEQQVTEWALSQAKISDKTMTFKEVMKPENNQEGAAT